MKVNKSLYILPLLFTLLLGGCSMSTVNTKDYESRKPQKIAVLVGYDIRAVKDLSTGGLIASGVIGGGVGAIIASEHTERMNLHFDKDITNMIWSEANRQLRAKNYLVNYIGPKAKKWKLLDDLEDNSDIYPRFVQFYRLSSREKSYDAVLFIEILIEGRVPESGTTRELNVANMKMKYAKSKLYLYDTKSGKRLFFNQVQEGYSSTSKIKLKEAINAIVELDAIPAY